jgi:NNP family nitrate/nitrite transporter-like MFS transporter
MSLHPPGKRRVQLLLATVALIVCFSIFGSVSAMMPALRARLGLGPLEVSVALAIPVLFGSLGRIPLGMLTDRFGGRIVFSLMLLTVSVPVMFLGEVRTFRGLLLLGLFIGVALASFPIGAAFVSRWYPADEQGTALGIYGIGTGGGSCAAFLAPLIVSTLGFRWGFWTFGLAAAVWLVVFATLARNAPSTVRPRTLSQLFEPFRDPQSWVLSLFYFLTFGGFVAIGIYLPTLLTEIFGLTPRDAGMRAAGFIVASVGVRPIGGWLADRVGGRRVLLGVFPAAALFSLFLASGEMLPFTVGALAVGIAIGVGNGAVFRLVPEYFPKNVGAVTGLVGAWGGLGGFFPPLILGLIRRQTGSYGAGFVLLAAVSLVCWIVALRLEPREVNGATQPA